DGDYGVRIGDVDVADAVGGPLKALALVAEPDDGRAADRAAEVFQATRRRGRLALHQRGPGRPQRNLEAKAIDGRVGSRGVSDNLDLVPKKAVVFERAFDVNDKVP